MSGCCHSHSWTSKTSFRPGRSRNAFSEQGLLGLAFHPDYHAQRRSFSSSYTDRQGSTVVARYQADASDPDLADAESGRNLIPAIGNLTPITTAVISSLVRTATFTSPWGMAARPTIPWAPGQNRQLLLGSILRIDVDGEPRPTRSRPIIPSSMMRRRVMRFGLTGCATSGASALIA